MKITFSTIKSGEIFCDDFLCLTDLNGGDKDISKNDRA